jgi:hypothetical protein
MSGRRPSRRPAATTARVCVLSALVAAVLPSAMPVAADAKHTPKCHLKGRRVVDNRYVQVARRDVDGIRISACERATGRVLRIAETGDPGLGSASASVEQHARTTLIVSSEFGNQYGASFARYAVFLPSGRRQVLTSWDSPIASPVTTTSPFGTYALASRGQLARAIVVDQTTVVLGYDARGYETVLDAAPRERLPVESLAMTGTTARWVKDGVTKSFDLRQL